MISLLRGSLLVTDKTSGSSAPRLTAVGGGGRLRVMFFGKGISPLCCPCPPSSIRTG